MWELHWTPRSVEETSKEPVSSDASSNLRGSKPWVGTFVQPYEGRYFFVIYWLQIRYLCEAQCPVSVDVITLSFGVSIGGRVGNTGVSIL